MNLEEKIRIIEEKINNLPQEFDEEEKHIILHNPRLMNLIQQILLNNPDLCNEDVFDCLEEAYISSLPEEELNKIYVYYLENLLKEKIVSTAELERTANQLSVNEEDVDRLKDIINQAFLNRNLTIERFSTSEEAIQEMMKHQRYDLISQIKEAYISDEILDKIWESYPFDEYQFPRFFANSSYLADKYIEHFPLKYAIGAYINATLQTTYGLPEEKEAARKILVKYVDTMLDKLSTSENVDLSYLEEGTYFIQGIFLERKRVPISDDLNDKMNQIAVILFKNGLYDIMHNLLQLELITKEEAREVIIKVAKNGDTKKLEALSLVYVVDFFKDDKELIDILLENGFVKDAEMFDYQYFEEKKPYILEQLNKKNPKYKEFAKLVSIEDELKIEFEEAKLESGFVEKIFLSYYYSPYSDEMITRIKEILIKYPNIEFSCDGIISKDFLKILPELKQTSRLNSIIDFIKKCTRDEIVEVINKVNEDNTLTNFIRNNINDSIKLMENIIDKIDLVPEILDIYYENDVYIKRIIEYVIHHENLESFYTEENYQKLKPYLTRTYNISTNKLDKIEATFGPFIIRYIKNENIKLLLDLSIEEIDKILALFPKEEYTLEELKGTYDSLKQYEFSKKYAKDIQIFPTLLHAIEDKDNELVDELIKKIAESLDEVFIKRFLVKYSLPKEYVEGDLVKLVTLVVDKIKTTTGDKLEKYRTILHEMTDHYISRKREQYRDTYNMEEELEIPYTLEEKSTERALIKYIIVNSLKITTNIENKKATERNPVEDHGWGPVQKREYFSLAEYLILELMKDGVSKEVAGETLYYYITKNKEKCKNFKEVKKNIQKLIKITQAILNKELKSTGQREYGLSNLKIQNFITEADKAGEIRRIYHLEKDNIMFEILTQLNIESLKKGVLSDDKVYESLLKTMQKRKLHLLPKGISNILGKKYLNISSDLTNVAGFISYYGSIHDIVKRNLEANGKSTENILLNITNILIYAEVYSGISSVYSQILGNEDAKLIKANPKPNEALSKTANEERLKEAVERTKKLFERQEVTIPTFTEDLSLESDKKMHVVVGNFTHSSNLTHGERTGACMRIGGAGESLFEFALDNPNGFHIRFEDPVTHEYISRVTGFRNGNTVFLNELRDSCNKEKYSNKDVIDACRQTAKLLIEKSKDSTCPIENVVVHRAYATEEMKDPMVNLGVSNIKKGLPKFYSDVGQSAIILATTAKNGIFTNLDFNKNNVPTYQPVREKAIVVKTLQEASGRINRVNSVKRLINEESYEYIEPYQFPKGLIYAIVADDWYIYVDEQGNIIKDIIDIDPRAKEELAEALIEVEKNLAQIKSENQEVKHGL